MLYCVKILYLKDPKIVFYNEYDHMKTINLFYMSIRTREASLII